MYLSRLLLNPYSRRVQRDIANPYELHRTVMAAFAPELPKEERVLHRLEHNPRTGQILLLVQSHTAPDWSHLVDENYLLPADPFSGLDNPAVKQLALTLKVGQQLRFRLRANPTKRLFKDSPDGKLKKGQRIGLLKEADQLAWLQRKGAEKSGFAVLSASVANDGFATGTTAEKDKFKHFTVSFDGILQITNAEDFITTLQKGIGGGKGFGCGLLSIAPA